MMPQDNREQVELLVDACAARTGALCHSEAYQTLLPPQVLQEHHPICQLKTLHAIVVLYHWAFSRQAGTSEL